MWVADRVAEWPSGRPQIIHTSEFSWSWDQSQLPWDTLLGQHPLQLLEHSCLDEPGVALLSVRLFSPVASAASLVQTANEQHELSLKANKQKNNHNTLWNCRNVNKLTMVIAQENWITSRTTLYTDLHGNLTTIQRPAWTCYGIHSTGLWKINPHD